MWNKKKTDHLNKELLYGFALWTHPWSWPWSFKVNIWELIDMEGKGCESIFRDHECDLWVTMVGWVDVPDSDWGDFRRRRAVDISSLFNSL